MGKYICENGHRFDVPETLWDSTDLVRCCPIDGCTAGENYRIGKETENSFVQKSESN